MFDAIITVVVTPLIAALVFYIRKSIELSAWKFELQTKQSIIPYSQRIAFDKLIQQQLDKLHNSLGADAVVYCKIHNGEFYADKRHVLKFSGVLESASTVSYKEQLQNRLICDAPVFFADLDKDGIAYGEISDDKICVGFSRILKALGVVSYAAAQVSLNNGVPSAIIIAFYKNSIEHSKLEENAAWLKQEFNTMKAII